MYRIPYLVFSDLTVDFRKLHQIIECAEIRKKSRSFDDNADIVGNVDILADKFFVYGNFSRCGRDQPADHLHQHRFAAAVPADQPDNVPLFDVQTDIVYHCVFLIFFGDIFHTDNTVFHNESP